MNSINFRGTYINSAPIKKYDSDQYKTKEVAFVEMNPRDMGDLFAIDYVDRKWNTQITECINFFAKNTTKYDDKRRRYFVLTEQDDRFEMMRGDKILGIAEVYQGDDINSLGFLQVNPKYTHLRPKQSLLKRSLQKLHLAKEDQPREYKQIGSSILDSLKTISDKSIDVLALDSAIGFYKTNGFVKVDDYRNDHYIWIKD